MRNVNQLCTKTLAFLFINFNFKKKCEKFNEIELWNVHTPLEWFLLFIRQNLHWSWGKPIFVSKCNHLPSVFFKNRKIPRIYINFMSKHRNLVLCFISEISIHKLWPTKKFRTQNEWHIHTQKSHMRNNWWVDGHAWCIRSFEVEVFVCMQESMCYSYSIQWKRIPHWKRISLLFQVSPRRIKWNLAIIPVLFIVASSIVGVRPHYYAYYYIK